ncbi:DUF2244 domain-containing protein [Antarcticirhabdus aurantiaca]|uniref:DUF2244 domain-containing protein n=1 Tax=Antarcticirhabdus aurantiaca TaxID=2606717 RepID=A0ACD4NS55_9HYPH|nr:DUF2244 domain-containing protein [Antarcticirhabdus aurantiaca]WAJ29563.1 DUF2244 domain-containing protein [Jeongeuplla avenae]
MEQPVPPPAGRGEDDDASRAEAPIFRALLVPYRSLGRRGFTIMMVLLGIVSLVSGVAFLAKGAWPVFGFFGLDVLLVWLAFRASYRSGRAREEVEVSRTDVSIRKISPEGRVREANYNPFYARLAVSRHEEIGITRMAVTARGQATEVGGFLNPDDRESFASALSKALSTARGR